MSTLDTALAALRGGDPEGAERIAQAAVDAAEARSGTHCAGFAQACFELASVLAAMGDYVRGAVAIRRAAQAEVSGERGERNRLTYLLNLGEFLLRAGRTDEAEAVLREGLAGRETFYGVDHPGYAYGIEPLVEVLLAQGRAQEAAALLEEGLAILRAANHPREAVFVAKRAVAHKLSWGLSAPVFGEVIDAPEALVDSVVWAAIGQAKRYEAQVGLALLSDLRPAVEARRAGARTHHELLAAIANQANAAGAHDARVEAFQALLALTGDDPRRVDIIQALALALGEAGRGAEAEVAYDEALAAARAEDDPSAISQVQRNRGLYLAEHGRVEPARAAFVEAVEVARDALDEPMYGRALVARGIFSQHHGELVAAARDLERGLDRLSPKDHVARCGQSHLAALRAEAKCGCRCRHKVP